jgi:hypothetical protein
MKKILLLVFAMLHLNNLVQGQNVLACAGTNQYASVIQQSYTLGEPFVSENIVGSFEHSNGFQQPEIPIFNLKMFIQGFYLGGGVMSPVVDPVNWPLLSDTISISFIKTDLSTAPVFQKKILLKTNGLSSTFLPTALFGHPYYLKINHRNSVETWSKLPISLSTVNNFDLTTP